MTSSSTTLILAIFLLNVVVVESKISPELDDIMDLWNKGKLWPTWPKWPKWPRWSILKDEQIGFRLLNPILPDFEISSSSILGKDDQIQSTTSSHCQRIVHPPGGSGYASAHGGLLDSHPTSSKIGLKSSSRDDLTVTANPSKINISERIPQKETENGRHRRHL